MINKRFNNLVVVLDPGHAKTTPGKRSPILDNGDRLYEFLFNREITDLLAEMLRGYGIEVFITTDETRDKDKDIALSERVNRANNFIKNSGKKGLFISVHANAAGSKGEWTKARGWEAYTTKGQNNSDKLADCLYFYAEQIFPDAGQKIRKDKTDGDPDKEENFTVIYKMKYPAVLVENFFYDNKEDFKYMTSDAGKLDIANVMLFGILKFATEFYNL